MSGPGHLRAILRADQLRRNPAGAGWSVYSSMSAERPRCQVPVILLRLRRYCPYGLGDGEQLTGLLHPSLDGIQTRRTIHVGAADGA